MMISKNNSHTIFITSLNCFIWMRPFLFLSSALFWWRAVLCICGLYIYFHYQGIGGTGSVLGGNHPEIRIHAQVKGYDEMHFLYICCQMLSYHYQFLVLCLHGVVRLGPRFLLSVYLQNAGQQPVLGVSWWSTASLFRPWPAVLIASLCLCLCVCVCVLPISLYFSFLLMHNCTALVTETTWWRRRRMTTRAVLSLVALLAASSAYRCPSCCRYEIV